MAKRNIELLHYMKCILLVRGGYTENVPAIRYQAGYKIPGTPGKIRPVSQSHYVRFSYVVQHQKGHDQSQCISWFIILAALHGKQIVISADDFKNPATLRYQRHQVVSIVPGG